MTEPIFEVINEDIFSDTFEASAICWWLVKLAGGKVVFPVEEDFWLNNYAENTRLVLRKENGQLVLVAEEKCWTESQD